jgi:tetratricopeptide (TPR) repeat protein
MTTRADPATARPYATLDEMRAAHSRLLRRCGEHPTRDPSIDLLAGTREFLARGRETGELLGDSEDRLDAQSMLNYWATFLYRYSPHVEDEPPVAALRPFGASEWSGITGPDDALDAGDGSDVIDDAGSRGGFLSDLKQRLLAGGNIALYGVPGMGKTSIAAKLARDPDVRRQFEDGVLWANLGDYADVSAILDVWSTKLRLRESDPQRSASVEDRRRAIRRAVSRRRILFVIDDAWNLADALALKLGGPDCAHLLTTYPIQVAVGFDPEGIVAAAGLEELEGLHLLARYVPDVLERHVDVARRLVAALDGSPLALSLVAKQCAAHGGAAADLGELLRRLVEEESRIGEEPRLRWAAVQSAPGQAAPSLLTAVTWCAERLTDDERDTLRALSSFPPKPSTFSDDAALHVTGGRRDALTILVERGLLEMSGTGRYALHGSVSEYLHILPAPPADASRRMAEFFVDAIRRQPGDVGFFEREQANVLAALDAAARERLWRPLVDGTAAVVGHLDRRGQYERAKAYLERALVAAQALADADAEAAVLLSLGEMEERLGDFSAATARLERAWQLAEGRGHRDLLARTLQNLGVAASAQGDDRSAESHLMRALVLARADRDRARQCAIYTRLGWVETNRGHFSRARWRALRGLALACMLGDRAQTAQLLLSLGVTAYHEGKFEEARRLDLEGLEHAEAVRDSYLRCALLQALGGVETELAARGAIDFEAAEVHLYEALRISEEMGYRWYRSITWKEIGELRLKQRSLNLAAEAFAKGLEFGEGVGSPEAIGLALYGLARVADERRRPADARLQGRTSLRYLEPIRHHQAEEVRRLVDRLYAVPADIAPAVA